MKGQNAGARRARTTRRRLNASCVMKRVLTQIEKLLAVAGVELSNLLPLDYALAVLGHPDSTPEQRRWACEKALRFAMSDRPQKRVGYASMKSQRLCRLAQGEYDPR